MQIEFLQRMLYRVRDIGIVFVAANQSEGRQAHERLTHGRPADGEGLTEFLLRRKLLVGLKSAVGDHFLDLKYDLVRKRSLVERRWGKTAFVHENAPCKKGSRQQAT